MYEFQLKYIFLYPHSRRCMRPAGCTSGLYNFNEKLTVHVHYDIIIALQSGVPTNRELNIAVVFSWIKKMLELENWYNVTIWNSICLWSDLFKLETKIKRTKEGVYDVTDCERVFNVISNIKRDLRREMSVAFEFGTYNTTREP